MATLGTTSKPAYVYDTETDTWVPIGVGAHTHDTSALVSVNNFNSAGKNFIINGGMDVWQRGTSLTFAQSWANFPTDRFKFNPRNGAGTGTRYELSVPSETSIVPCQYALKIAMTSSATSKPKLATYLGESQFYYGKTLTLSFYMKASKSISVDVSADLIWANADNVSTASTISVTTSWQRFSYTFSLSPSGTYNYSTDLWGLLPQWEFPSSDTYDVYISGVQLELGSAATLFSRSGGTMAGEVASCQRYFNRAINGSINGNYRLSGGQAISTSAAEINYSFPVPMRTSPTLSVSSASHFMVINSTGGVAGYPTGLSGGILTPTNARVDATGASGLIAGNATSLQVANSSATLDFNAEL